MKAKRYDLFQLANRHKIGFHAMGILLVLIFVNGIIKESYGFWASPMLEMYVLIFLPSLYFIISSIAKNAYLSQRDHPVLILILFGLGCVLSAFANIPSLFNGTFKFVDDGQLSDSVGSVLLMIMTGSVTFSLLLKMKLNKRMAMSED